MALKTILFDFDGTLVDTFAASLEIANRIAPEFGYRRIAPEEVETLRGWAYGRIVDHIGVSWHKLPAIANRIRSELTEQLERLEPVEGLPEVLCALRGRGFELGILTSNSRDNVARFLDTHRLDHFAFVNTSSSLWGKRRRLRAILKQRRRAFDEAAYVGDEVRDIEAAQALGVPMVAVSWGYSRKELLALHAPSHLIERPADLLDV
ncbi:MAG: HAD-IA family hydrolase, partial [Polyangiales bacterium]